MLEGALFDSGSRLCRLLWQSVKRKQLDKIKQQLTKYSSTSASPRWNEEKPQKPKCPKRQTSGKSHSSQSWRSHESHRASLLGQLWPHSFSSTCLRSLVWVGWVFVGATNKSHTTKTKSLHFTSPLAVYVAVYCLLTFIVTTCMHSFQLLPSAQKLLVQGMEQASRVKLASWSNDSFDTQLWIKKRPHRRCHIVSACHVLPQVLLWTQLLRTWKTVKMLWQVMRCLLDHAALCCRYLTCCSSVPLWWRPNQFTVSGACNCNAYLAPAEPLLNVSQESWASRGSEDLSPWERKRTMKGQRWSNKIQLHQHILNCQLYKCAKKRNAYL